MEIDFQCGCGEKLSAIPTMVGELMDCPACEQLVKVPPRKRETAHLLPTATLQTRGERRITRAPTCKSCKTRLVPVKRLEQKVMGCRVAQSMIVVGLVIAAAGAFFQITVSILGLAISVCGLFGLNQLQETKMELSCPKCSPQASQSKALRV